jgi:hypothetical protein
LQETRFYRDEEEWNSIAERLKQMPCPHCKAVGTLNRHGSLYGYDESSPGEEIPRAHRIFCSNRNARPGCGRTHSIWLADKIRRLSLTTRGLWQFLQNVVSSGIAAATRAIRDTCRLTDRTLQRIWKRFDLHQSQIRTVLLAQRPPPELVPGESRRSTQAQVLAHLQAAFPDSDCPIAAFQQANRTFFV